MCNQQRCLLAGTPMLLRFSSDRITLGRRRLLLHVLGNVHCLQRRVRRMLRVG